MNLSTSTSTSHKTYRPLSTSALSSPPPLSSAGLSSRLDQSASTTESNHPTSYRLSTLIPNRSGYLSFLGRSSTADFIAEPRAQGWRRRSASLKSIFSSISTGLKRVRSNSSFSAYSYESSLVLPPPVEYRKVENEGLGRTVGGSPSSSSAGKIQVEDIWKLEAKYLKGDFGHCLSGARCISITDPVAEFADELLQSTVIINSSDDSLSNVTPLPILRARPRVSAGLECWPCPIAAREPALARLAATSPTSPELIIEADDFAEMPTCVRVQDTGTGRRGKRTTTLKISDCRSGTAAGSTKRVPTQRSVHPVRGGKCALETVRPSLEAGDMQSRLSTVSRSRLIVANPDPESEGEEEEDGSWLTPSSRGQAHLEADTSFDAPAARDLTVDNELGRSLVGARTSATVPDVVRIARERRSVSFRRAIGSSPIQEQGFSLPQFQDTDSESESFTANNHTGGHQDEVGQCNCTSHDRVQNDKHDSSHAPTNPRIERSYREQLRRLYVSPYNDSPTPNTAWVVVRPPPDSIAGPTGCEGGLHGEASATTTEEKKRGTGKRRLVRGGQGRVMKKLKRGNWRRVGW
ncbi:hypothetical protein IAU59_001295 [Kwoniella sp. CBS 9459]